MKVKETLKWAKNRGNLIIASSNVFMEERALTMSADNSKDNNLKYIFNDLAKDEHNLKHTLEGFLTKARDHKGV